MYSENVSPNCSVLVCSLCEKYIELGIGVVTRTRVQKDSDDDDDATPSGETQQHKIAWQEKEWRPNSEHIRGSLNYLPIMFVTSDYT